MTIKSLLRRIKNLPSTLLPPKSYSLYDIDLKLKEYLSLRGGFFIEAGAHDGIGLSNTALFEKKFGWKGLLIEPVPRLYEKCRRNRSNSIVKNYALSSEDGGFLTVQDFDFYSYVETSSPLQIAHKNIASKRYGYTDRPNQVPKIRLSTLLDTLGIKKIDFFSLDVEQYEPEVLKGIDFTRHRPTYMLIEGGERPEVQDILKSYYEIVCQLTPDDTLFKAI